VRRALSLRFDRALAGSEREAVASLLVSLAATPTSWALAGSPARTYVRCEAAPEAEGALAQAGAARIDVPPLVVLEIIPEGGAGLAALEGALGGPGRPRTIVSCERTAAGLLVELESEANALDLAVAVIDAELRGRARRIVPLLPLEDEVLARFVAARLGAPGFGASRIIETHAEALLGA
jgi:hypothetical protein